MYGMETRCGRQVSYNTRLCNSETCLLKLCNSNCAAYADIYAVYSYAFNTFWYVYIRKGSPRENVRQQTVYHMKLIRIYNVVLEKQLISTASLFTIDACIYMRIYIASFLWFENLKWRYHRSFVNTLVILCLWFTNIISLRNLAPLMFLF